MGGFADIKPIGSTPGMPLYAAVRDAVRRAIDEGVIGPGEQLPSTKVLSEQMGVSLVTAHRALQELVSSGVLRRGQGRGTFVHEGYRDPERRASEMRFGLVFHAESSLADPYHGRILEGVRREANERGVDLVLLRYGEDWRKECRGYLFVNPFPEQFEGASLGVGGSGRGVGGRVSGSARSAAVMAVGASPGCEGVGSVDTDNVSITRRAVELLVSLGHRELGYVGGATPASNSLDRERGFVEGCAACGVAVNAAWVVRGGDWQLDVGGVGRLESMLVGRTLGEGRRPTAVVTGGYYFALDVYTAAKGAGLSLPEDLSVTGVDDPPSAGHLSPSLTTFRQPLEELGRRAVGDLLEVLAGRRGAGERRTLAAELVVRESAVVSAGGASGGSGEAGRGVSMAAVRVGRSV